MRVNEINWEEVQKFYDEGYCTWDMLIEKFKLNSGLIAKAVKDGVFKSRTKYDSKRLNPNKTKRKMSEETKKKISEARKKYLAENPEKMPYLLYHVHKNKFYSEEFFEECLVGTSYKPQVRVGSYCLDFADTERKIDLEIDGFQHFNHQPIIEHDKKRNAFLLDLGFTIIRIRWAEFKKLTREQREFVVKCIIENKNPNLSCVLYLTPVNPTSSYEEYMAERTKKFLCACGCKKDQQAKRCHSCHSKNQRKVERPSKETLLNLISQYSYRKIGKMFGVADNTIRKWLKYYEK